MTEGAARVLTALREAEGRPCSGESLSHGLGVSRAQVWKHVEQLRGLGYAIEGEPGGGYRLVAPPDRLYAEEIRNGLATRWLAHEIRHEEETDSTNRLAHEWARAGAPHGATVVAESQTAGRGRLGRSFFSPAGRSLYTSIVLRPRLDTRGAPTTILATAIAVAECVAHEVGAERVEIKWPNDVLIAGRKTSGILMEMASEGARVAYLVLGIGVNLNVEREAFPPEFRESATSVAAELGRPMARADFARRLYGTLEDVLDVHEERGFAALRPRFERFYRMAGRDVLVTEVGGGSLRGEALSPDTDGALPVRTADGAVHRVLAGDVTLAPQEARS